MNTGNNSSSADNQQVSKKKVHDAYFSGFVDGEGCFYVGFSKRNDLPMKWQILTEFHVSQNPGGKNVLEALKKRLGCGYIKLNHAKSAVDKSWVFIVKNHNDLRKKVIPFFDQHPLQTVKRKEYEVFKRVLFAIEQKRHRTKEGFKEIVRLVFSLRKNTKKRYSQDMLLSS